MTTNGPQTASTREFMSTPFKALSSLVAKERRYKSKSTKRKAKSCVSSSAPVPPDASVQSVVTELKGWPAWSLAELHVQQCCHQKNAPEWLRLHWPLVQCKRQAAAGSLSTITIYTGSAHTCNELHWSQMCVSINTFSLKAVAHIPSCNTFQQRRCVQVYSDYW